MIKNAEEIVLPKQNIPQQIGIIGRNLDNTTDKENSEIISNNEDFNSSYSKDKEENIYPSKGQYYDPFSNYSIKKHFIINKYNYYILFVNDSLI